MPIFLSSHQNSVPVLEYLWKLNNDVMIKGMCELYN